MSDRASSFASFSESDDGLVDTPRVTLKGTNSGVAGCSNLTLSSQSAEDCREAIRTGNANEIWIFGFGSLVWKPGE